MTLFWNKCLTYQDAKNYTKVIYLHEWFGKAFYWGKVDKSFFGGNKTIERKSDGRNCSPRYNSSYAHWIEGCLKHRASLYIAEMLENPEGYTLCEVEGYLIKNYVSEMNKKKGSETTITIQHVGEVPETIKYNNSFTSSR
jgi:hypothetical protein